MPIVIAFMLACVVFVFTVLDHRVMRVTKYTSEALRKEATRKAAFRNFPVCLVASTIYFPLILNYADGLNGRQPESTLLFITLLLLVPSLFFLFLHHLIPPRRIWSAEDEAKREKTKETIINYFEQRGELKKSDPKQYEKQATMEAQVVTNIIKKIGAGWLLEGVDLEDEKSGKKNISLGEMLEDEEEKGSN